ncbi:hypothetical protein Glove_209g104 [Diversispora epigaea]|uniref:Uncharacterized protein n=1 Tax=Diversispora epigaea TaxID=1348612 RepID=A0A397IRW3_9GLOM|nr:hypothetical protein Glove_209g104 [Diversispora epigaea]
MDSNLVKLVATEILSMWKSLNQKKFLVTALRKNHEPFAYLPMKNQNEIIILVTILGDDHEDYHLK